MKFIEVTGFILISQAVSGVVVAADGEWYQDSISCGDTKAIYLAYCEDNALYEKQRRMKFCTDHKLLLISNNNVMNLTVGKKTSKNMRYGGSYLFSRPKKWGCVPTKMGKFMLVETNELQLSGNSAGAENYINKVRDESGTEIPVFAHAIYSIPHGEMYSSKAENYAKYREFDWPEKWPETSLIELKKCISDEGAHDGGGTEVACPSVVH